MQPAPPSRSAAARTRATARVQCSPGPAISQIRTCARRMDPRARHPKSHALPSSPCMAFGEAGRSAGSAASAAERLGEGAARGRAWPAPSGAGSASDRVGSEPAAWPGADSALRASSRSSRASLTLRSCSKASSSLRSSLGASAPGCSWTGSGGAAGEPTGCSAPPHARTPSRLIKPVERQQKREAGRRGTRQQDTAWGKITQFARLSVANQRPSRAPPILGQCGTSMPRDQASKLEKNWRLLATRGPLKGKTFLLGPRTILGRAVDCDVQILAEGVSRQHAAIIENDEGEPYLMDLASKNGTFVDDQPILRVRLDPGTSFRISASVFAFSIEGEPAAPEAPITQSRAPKSTARSDSDE